MKVKLYVISASILLALGAAGCALALHWAARPVALDIYAYDDCGGCFAGDNPCKPCTVLEQLQLTYYGVLERAGAARDSKLRVMNTRGAEGQAALALARERLGLGDGQIEFPLVVLNGSAGFSGARAPADLADALGRRSLSRLFQPAPAASASFSNAEAVYFYSEYCGECVRTAEILGRWERSPAFDRVALAKHCIDSDEGYALLTAYLSDYGLAHISATVPCLFRGRNYHYGSDEIGAVVEAWIREAEAGSHDD